MCWLDWHARSARLGDGGGGVVLRGRRAGGRGREGELPDEVGWEAGQQRAGVLGAGVTAAAVLAPQHRVVRHQAGLLLGQPRRGCEAE